MSHSLRRCCVLVLTVCGSACVVDENLGDPAATDDASQDADTNPASSTGPTTSSTTTGGNDMPDGPGSGGNGDSAGSSSSDSGTGAPPADLCQQFCAGQPCMEFLANDRATCVQVCEVSFEEYAESETCAPAWSEFIGCMATNECSEITCAQPSIAIEELCSCGGGGGGEVGYGSCEYDWSCYAGEIDLRFSCDGSECTCFDHEEEVATCVVDNACGDAFSDVRLFALDCCGFDYSPWYD